MIYIGNMNGEQDEKLNALQQARLIYFAMNNKVVQPTAILTVEDAAGILGMQESTVRTWIRKGQLKVARLGTTRNLRIIGQDLLDFVQSKKKEIDNEPIKS